MSMLRLPTFVNFPFIVWNKNKNTRDIGQEESSVTSPLLLSEEALVKHHGSIIPPSYQEQELPTSVINIKKLNFFSSLKENEMRNELIAVLRFSIPLMVTFLLGVGNRVVDVWFLGRVGPDAMAVASLASLFTTVTGVSIGLGVMTAIDTLVAQAFTGANNPHTIGVILQRALIIMYIFGALIAIVWAYAESILIYMGQEPEIAKMAQTFITVYTPNVFLVFTVIAVRKFLQGLGEMKVTLYLVLFLFPVNIMTDYFVFIYLELGFIGAAYQSLMMLIVTLSVYILFILKYTDTKKYWPGFTTQALTQWGEFLKLGIPGMLSVSTDWAFEVCAIIAGVLGKTSLAAQSVVLTVNMLLLMIPNAITSALIVRLGHHLGSNQPRKTMLCVMISVFLGFLFVLIDAALMYTYRSEIAHTFSKDEAVIEAIIGLMGVGSLSHFALGFGVVLSGTLNAFGKQHVVACFNIVSYYLIGLPFGLYMTSQYDWGLIGIWSGVVLSGVVKSIGEGIIILFYIDWQQECLNAAKRINKQEI